MVKQSECWMVQKKEKLMPLPSQKKGNILSLGEKIKKSSFGAMMKESAILKDKDIQAQSLGYYLPLFLDYN